LRNGQNRGIFFLEIYLLYIHPCRAHAYRAGQTINPNIRVEMPDPLVGTSRQNIEVKTVSGKSWYKLTGARAVERRVLAIST
jgi:hypothetical protein